MRRFIGALEDLGNMWTLKAFTAVSLSMILTSCDVHQFPEKVKEEEKEIILVPLQIVFDSPDFYLWEHVYDPMNGSIREQYPDLEIFPGYPGVSQKYDNTLTSGVIDVTIKAYLASNTSVLMAEDTFTYDLHGDPYDRKLDMALPVDTEYELAVWTHFREHAQGFPFYDTSDFNKVQLIGDNYKGNTDYRDGYSGILYIDTYRDENSDGEKTYTVTLTRPMGKFEFLTIDLSEFLDRETSRRNIPTRARAEDYVVVVSFPYYFPSSYSVIDDRLENSLAGVSFSTRMTVTGESEASLGFEYVMINDITDGGVQAKVDIYDPSMVHVAGSTTLTIPVRRDHHTLLRGAFLSEDNEGGIGIDPDFEGDFNITM